MHATLYYAKWLSYLSTVMLMKASPASCCFMTAHTQIEHKHTVHYRSLTNGVAGGRPLLSEKAALCVGLGVNITLR